MGHVITVWVLIAITSTPHGLHKEYAAAFSSEEHCQIERRAVEGLLLHTGVYFCQKELLK